MTAAEFKQAVTLSRDNANPKVNVADMNCFDGFGLPDFETVYVTVFQVARLIRWQAVQLNGEFDQVALDEVKRCGRNRFQIIA